jgi:hypothetical protein
MKKQYKGREIVIEVHPLGRRWGWSFTIDGHDSHRLEEAPAEFESTAVEDAYAAACVLIDQDLY